MKKTISINAKELSSMEIGLRRLFVKLNLSLDIVPMQLENIVLELTTIKNTIKISDNIPSSIILDITFNHDGVKGLVINQTINKDDKFKSINIKERGTKVLSIKTDVTSIQFDLQDKKIFDGHFIFEAKLISEIENSSML